MVDGRILDCFFASLRGERERERVSLIATLLSGWDGRKKGEGDADWVRELIIGARYVRAVQRPSTIHAPQKDEAVEGLCEYN